MDLFKLEIDKILLFLILFIPGFISIKVWSMAVPSDKQKVTDYIIEAICYSTFNFISLIWLINLSLDKVNQENHPVWCYIGIFFIFVGFPFIWPLLLKGILSIKRVNKIFKNPTPKAWDAFFSKQLPCFILVHLKEGEMIGGLYNDGSFASAYPNTEDLYISEVWNINEDGQFVEKMEDTLGIWIKCEQISYLEFFDINVEGEEAPITEIANTEAGN